MLKKILKALKYMLYSIIGIVLVITIVVVLFIKLSPEFGGKITAAQKKEFAKTGHYKDSEFQNILETKMDMDFWKMIGLLFKKDPSRNPVKDISPSKIDSLNIANYHEEQTRLTWFGHSSFLLELEGQKLLLDPMLGETPSPTPIGGPKRYSKDLPIQIEKLPFIDAVVFSHDHYDHLDYGTIKKLKDKVGNFYVPLGVGSHLLAWGVDSSKVHEFDWWKETSFSNITLVCTPSRHFSGRGLTDRNATLWASWVIKGKKDNIFFSGDSGYGPHFKEIGDKFGAFDIALMECGQYNEMWHCIHMMPEETAQAAKDLNAEVFMPIHWGAFTLAYHSWTDSIERVKKKAQELELSITTPAIGEQFVLQKDAYPNTEWWTEYK